MIDTQTERCFDQKPAKVGTSVCGRLVIALKLLAIISLNVFLASVALSLAFGDYSSSGVIIPPGWLLWPLAVSTAILIGLLAGLLFVGFNLALYGLFFPKPKFAQQTK